MAHVPFRADISEVAQGNAVRWNAAEEFYNNQGTNLTLQHMSARHIIVFPSANIVVTLPDTNTLLDGWQVHVGFPFSTSDNPYEITVKDAAGTEWRRLIKGQWCECVKKGGSWYVYPPGSVADTGTIVPGDPPPQPPTVPSGTLLETLGSCGNLINNCVNVILKTPATKSGFIRSFTANFRGLSVVPGTSKIFMMTGSITGTTFTKKKEVSWIRGSFSTICMSVVLPTPLAVDVGDYIGICMRLEPTTNYWGWIGLASGASNSYYYNFSPSLTSPPASGSITDYVNANFSPKIEA